MKRLLWLVAVLAALGVFPAAAYAADVTGVAIAKDGKRKTIVTASADGAVRTIRVRSRFGKFRLGQRLKAQGRLLTDGTLAATRVQPLGRARQVRFRAVVVSYSKKNGRLVLSAGKSVFAVRMRAAERAAASNEEGLKPGDQIVCEAKVGHAGLVSHEQRITETGHTNKLELEGIYLFDTENGFDLAVVHRGLVHVFAPDGFDLPELGRGDEVSLVVEVEKNGSFTLVSVDVEGDEEHADDDEKSESPPVKGELWVAGVISALTPAGVAVKPDDDRPVVACALPEGKSLAGFAVGDRVKLHCRLDGSHYVIAELKSEKAFIGADGSGELYAYGVITELGSGFVRVQPDGDRPSIRCDFDEGVDLSGFAAGDRVKLHCHFHEGHPTLAELKSEHAYIVVEK
jgi:hypothetical protein